MRKSDEPEEAKLELSEITNEWMRERIMAAQAALLAQPELHSEFEVKHHFAPGVYGREIFLPAGSRIFGKIHKHAHINTVSVGLVRVATEFGVEEIRGPISFVSEPGTKRVVHALEDTIWTTYHPNPTNTRDLALIEAEVIAESYVALALHQEEIKCLGDS